ncbi:uncharacterized protein STEHIDRAFT_155558 [Stereum hirsutum FP-91666 SS1]|uniref:uncharacterized protein n=1 Tax=Stereum hirsutum (strain FP-91666) TaxID=721885 RepID=UPI000440B25C|nr:uncharacterized protein STEHIDRAFT_155558 [Stereum hirsutum FP-91666 SS1]EIM88203.1 hypothetical protein STEHIDRAFT_155558 [Stereum hirsutum FP-91666 SS1]
MSHILPASSFLQSGLRGVKRKRDDSDSLSRPVRRPPGQSDHPDGRIVGKDLTIPASPASPKIQLRPIPKTITVSSTTSLLPASLYPNEWQSLPTVPLDEVSAIGLKKTMERPDAERYIRYARSLSIFDETKRERPLTDDENELRRQTEWSLLALCGARKAAARIEARQILDCRFQWAIAVQREGKRVTFKRGLDRKPECSLNALFDVRQHSCTAFLLVAQTLRVYMTSSGRKRLLKLCEDERNHNAKEARDGATSMTHITWNGESIPFPLGDRIEETHRAFLLHEILNVSEHASKKFLRLYRY